MGDWLDSHVLELTIWGRTRLSVNGSLKSHHLLPGTVVSKKFKKEEQLKGQSLSLKTPEAKAASAVATREAGPVVPLHLNSILSGKSNKQNAFKPRSKYTI